MGGVGHRNWLTPAPFIPLRGRQMPLGAVFVLGMMSLAVWGVLRLTGAFSWLWCEVGVHERVDDTECLRCGEKVWP